MDLADLDWGASFGGLFVLFQLAMAVAAWVLLAGRPQPLRIVAALIAFLFPVVAVVGIVLWFKLRGRRGAASNGISGLTAQLKDAVRQAQNMRSGQVRETMRPAAPQIAPSSATIVSTASTAPATSFKAAGTSVDIARLTSSDLTVRFGDTMAGERKLNIPRVVE